MLPKSKDDNRNRWYVYLAIATFILLFFLGFVEQPNRYDGYEASFSTSSAVTPTATTAPLRITAAEREKMRALLYRYDDLNPARWEGETVGHTIIGPRPTDSPSFLYQIISSKAQKHGRRGARYGDDLFQRVIYYESAELAVQGFQMLRGSLSDADHLVESPLSPENVPPSAVYVPNYDRVQFQCDTIYKLADYSCNLVAQHGRYVVEIYLVEEVDEFDPDETPAPTLPFLEDVAAVMAATEARLRDQVESEGG